MCVCVCVRCGDVAAALPHSILSTISPCSCMLIGIDYTAS